ncbi:MAG TPA: DUF2619 domain-containing protein [Firmicutes bacterium]|nr:DUF2619 domain-containing protein [Bacillota bacterium]
MDATLPLLVVFMAGLLAQSRPVALAAGALLLLHLTGFDHLSALVGRWGLPGGAALLAASVLAPLATGSVSFSLAPLATPGGLAVFAAGLLVTCLAQRGLLFLRLRPEFVLALTLGFLGALLWQAPQWPLGGSARTTAVFPGVLNESRAVSGMALLRFVSGALEVGAAFLMLRAGRVASALQLNAALGFVGPAVNLLVCALGVVFVATRFPWWKTGLVGLGAVLIWFGTR